MTSVASRSGGKEPQYYVIVEYTKNVSPGLSLVTLYERQRFIFFKSSSSKKEKEQKYNINKETPLNPGFLWMILPQGTDCDSLLNNDIGCTANTDISLYIEIKRLKPQLCQPFHHHSHFFSITCYQHASVMLPVCCTCSFSFILFNYSKCIVKPDYGTVSFSRFVSQY